MYAGFTGRTSSRILKSVDGGKNWIDMDGGFEDMWRRQARIKNIAVSPHNLNIIYAVLSERLYKSTDGGTSWNELKMSPNQKTGRNIWHRDILLTNDPNIIYLTTAESGLYRSTNGGKSWNKTHRNEADRIRINFITIDPKNHKIIYAGDNARLYKSTNSGRTWQTILNRPLKFEER